MRRKIEKIERTNSALAIKRTVTLREENSGIKEVDAASLLHIQHVKRLAAWTSGEAGIAPLGALLGRKLATDAEASGVRLDSSIFLCEKCETILQPAYNCTVRVVPKKNGRKSRSSRQNNVVYRCHFCQHENVIHGTNKCQLRDLLAANEKCSIGSELSPTESQDCGALQTAELAVPAVTTPNLNFEPTISSISSAKANDEFSNPRVVTSAEVTLERSETALIACGSVASSVRRAQNSNTSKAVPASVSQTDLLSEGIAQGNLKTPPMKHASQNLKSLSAKPAIGKNDSSNTDSSVGPASSKKRRRKGWNSLKQVAQRDEEERKKKMSHFVIPFALQC